MQLKVDLRLQSLLHLNLVEVKLKKYWTKFVRRQIYFAIGFGVSSVFAQTCPIPGASSNFATGKTGAGTGLVSTSPAGVSCGAQCAATFATNTMLTLSATPDPGSIFTGWTGNCAGAANATVALSTNSSCTANFDQFPWPTWTPAIPAVPPSSTGITYYVDATNGNNINNGKSLGAAFKTVAKAVSLIAAGDTVLIRKGLYREGILMISPPSGTAIKPITFGSYGDGEVILDGSTKVSGWTNVSGTVWKAPLTFNPIGIVVNDVPLKQVRQGQGGSSAPQDGLAGVTSGSGKWHSGGAGGFITADIGAVGDPNLADIVVPSDDGAQNHVYFYQKNYLTFKGLTIRGSGSNGLWGYGSNITVESCNVKFNGKSAISFQPLTQPGETNSDNAILTTHAYHNVLLNWPRGNNGFIESGGGWAGGIAWTGNLRPLARGNIVHMNGGEGIITYGTNAGYPSGTAIFEQNVGYDNWSVNMYFDNQPNNIARNNLLFNHPPDSNNFLYVGASPYDEYVKYSVCLMLADEQNSSDSTNNYANLANSQVYNNIFAGCRVGIRDYSEGNANAVKSHGIKNTKIVNNTIIMPFVSFGMFETIGIYLLDNTTPSGTNRNTNSFIQNNIVYGFNNDSLISTEIAGALGGINLDFNTYFSASNAAFRRGFNTVTYSNFAGWKTAIAGSDTNSQFIDPKLIDVTAFRAIGIGAYDPRNANLKAGSPVIGAGTAQSFLPAINFLGTSRSGWNAGAF